MKMLRITFFAAAALICSTQAYAVMYLARTYEPNMARWLTRDPIGERGGLNLYGFVRNEPISHWDALGFLTATGGTPHTSLQRHNNYLLFKISCPECRKFANWSVDYNGALSGLQALGLDSDMLVDAFGSFSGASDLGGKRDAKTPNCNGDPVDVTVYMRTRLSSQTYLNALHLEFGSVDGFPALSAAQTVGAYVAGTVVNYHCVHCDGLK